MTDDRQDENADQQGHRPTTTGRDDPTTRKRHDDLDQRPASRTNQRECSDEGDHRDDTTPDDG
jgi:hypothetical protein